MANGEDGQGLGRESLCLWELATTHSTTIKQDYQGENGPVSSRYGYYSVMFLVKLMVLTNSLPFREVTNVSFNSDFRFQIAFPGFVSLRILGSFISRPKCLQR